MKMGIDAPLNATGERGNLLQGKEPHQLKRALPIGAELFSGGGAHFRVWAPKSRLVKVRFETAEKGGPGVVELGPEANGYFSGFVQQARAGMLYRYELETGCFPDPASRFQPQGPHGASQIVDPASFEWTDQSWPGVKRSGQVIYELHIGTFTGAGTWEAAQKELRELADLGVTVIELMPVSEFPGRFGWGYDGVDLFAPTRLYGEPDDLRRFINEAHSLGLGVILDVVYNHFGPDGNFLKQFSDDYFTDRYKNEWGEPINFDGENSEPVREFFCANAAYWIDEFHMDGLRLDATQQIFDASKEHIVAALGRRVRQAARGKSTLIVAENECQQATLVRSVQQGGYDLDALWNDDFHHTATVALSGRAEAYYSDYKGVAQEFISSAKRGFIYQGQRSRWQGNPRGSWSLDLSPDQFINFLQNHDQVANSVDGRRIHQLCSPGSLRAMTALLLLAPATPMLFQGQEFAASAPFLYFADHNTELAPLVAVGRKSFLSQFPALSDSESIASLAVPHSEDTFSRCKLDLSERAKHKSTYLLHRDLIALRHNDPVFSRPRRGGVDGAVLSQQAFVLRFFGDHSDDRLLFINLGTDLLLAPMAEPLLAPSPGSDWELAWSSESPKYGGSGTAPLVTEQGWRVAGQAGFVVSSRPSRSTQDSKS